MVRRVLIVEPDHGIASILGEVAGDAGFSATMTPSCDGFARPTRAAFAAIVLRTDTGLRLPSDWIAGADRPEIIGLAGKDMNANRVDQCDHVIGEGGQVRGLYDRLRLLKPSVHE